ncbi:MAG: hypothetical protein M1834_007293 [Cirrosporium novae-zelandiae]|nr:MAG: hypothetical protein M1834_007293 [Cirrosporium novae-zelandiae]
MPEAEDRVVSVADPIIEGVPVIPEDEELIGIDKLMEIDDEVLLEVEGEEVELDPVNKDEDVVDTEADGVDTETEGVDEGMGPNVEMKLDGEVVGTDTVNDVETPDVLLDELDDIGVVSVADQTVENEVEFNQLDELEPDIMDELVTKEEEIEKEDVYVIEPEDVDKVEDIGMLELEELEYIVPEDDDVDIERVWVVSKDDNELVDVGEEAKVDQVQVTELDGMDDVLVILMIEDNEEGMYVLEADGLEVVGNEGQL